MYFGLSVVVESKFKYVRILDGVVIDLSTYPIKFVIINVDFNGSLHKREL